MYWFLSKKKRVMYWWYKSFLHMYPIKIHYCATFLNKFLKYFYKYLHDMIWLNAVKNVYTVDAHKLNFLKKCFFVVDSFV
jgi:hypothetical protein